MLITSLSAIVSTPITSLLSKRETIIFAKRESDNIIIIILLNRNRKRIIIANRRRKKYHPLSGVKVGFKFPLVIRIDFEES